nr:hypothetical protein [Tanacetum cinerariifolium]
MVQYMGLLLHRLTRAPKPQKQGEGLSVVEGSSDFRMLISNLMASQGSVNNCTTSDDDTPYVSSTDSEADEDYSFKGKSTQTTRLSLLEGLMARADSHRLANHMHVWFEEEVARERVYYGVKTGVKKCKKFYWYDPELDNEWYRRHLYGMYGQLNPHQIQDIATEISSHE